MKKIFLLPSFLLLSVWSAAQTQQGYVKTKGRLGNNGTVIAGTRLQGATVTVKGSNAVVSGNNGTFSLAIPTSNYYLQNVQKQGYVLTDPDVLSKQYALSKNPLVLVLEIPSQQTDDKLAAERKIRRTLQRQLQEKEDEIESLKEQQKLSEEEYRKQLQEIYAQQESNEKLISEMADRYSRMDFDEVDEFNRRISSLILEGKLTEADSLLNTKGDINNRAATLRLHQDANAQEEQEIKKKQKKLEKSKAMTQKELEDLAQDCYSKYEIFKIQHQNDSASYYIELRSSLDSNNIDYMYDAAYYYLYHYVKFEKAKYYFDSILDIAKRNENDLGIAKAVESLGLYYLEFENYSKALEYIKHAIEIGCKVHGEKSEFVASQYNNLGAAYIGMDDSNNALRCHLLALDIEKGIFLDKHPVIASSLSNIAHVYSEIGEKDTALVYYLEAKDILEFNGDSLSADLALAYNNVGYIYSTLGRYNDALKFHHKALNIRKVLYKDLHPAIAMSYQNIGLTYELQYEDSIALSYYQQAMLICKKIFGEFHPRTADSYRQMGSSYGYMNNYNQAVDMQMKALNIYLFNYGENSDVALLCNNIGFVYNKMDVPDSAFYYIDKAIEITKKIYGQDSPNLITPYNNKALVFSNCRQFEDAKTWYELALGISIQNFGKENLKTAKCYNNLGTLYSTENQYEDALNFFFNTLDIRKKLLGTNNNDVANTYYTIGNIYFKMKKYKVSLEYLEIALSIKETIFGKDNNQTKVVKNLLQKVLDESR